MSRDGFHRLIKRLIFEQSQSPEIRGFSEGPETNTPAPFLKPTAIFATNTSYLDIDQIAEACLRPESVIGLHFFSPANLMRLLEVIPGKRTSPTVVSAVMVLGKRLGKVTVRAGNCPGFIGNQMLRVYRREAQFLLEEGATPLQVDLALQGWGMAMGPFASQDLSGIDIAISSRDVFGRIDPPEIRIPRVIDALYAAGRLGQKTRAGWYQYDKELKAHPDPAVDEIILEVARETKTARRTISDEEIVKRCIYALVHEGARILEEGHAARASDIDVVYVNGYGFPAYRGGPLHFADSIGVRDVYEGILQFQRIDEASCTALLLNEIVEKTGHSQSGMRNINRAERTPQMLKIDLDCFIDCASCSANLAHLPSALPAYTHSRSNRYIRSRLEERRCACN